jgi:hypothetical protein
MRSLLCLKFKIFVRGRSLMEASHILNNLVEGIIENLEVLRGSGVINAEVISDYSEMVERNLHSWLQYTVLSRRTQGLTTEG